MGEPLPKQGNDLPPDEGSTDNNVGWKTYERVVAAAEAENTGVEFTVTPNATLRGAISGRSRQVDVLIDCRWSDDVSHRTIVDAKLRRRKVDIRDVEALLGMMQDCRAARGILVCTTGYTKAALARAQNAVTIKLLNDDDVDEFSWASYEPCLGSCHNRELPNQRGLVLWDGKHLLGIANFWFIAFTGKCDVCHQFHVWCWDCGSKFSIPEENHVECGCEGRLWASVIEEELAQSGTLNAAHLLMVDQHLDPSNGPVALDRRALR